MRVISKARLRQFWESSKRQNAEGPLQAWHKHASSKTVAWQSWGDVKADFSRASAVGNCIVFDIGGNRFRLVVRVLYRSQKVFILRVMTHREYDDQKWQDECGCFASPPKRQDSGGGKAPRVK